MYEQAQNSEGPMVARSISKGGALPPPRLTSNKAGSPVMDNFAVIGRRMAELQQLVGDLESRLVAVRINRPVDPSPGLPDRQSIGHGDQLTEIQNALSHDLANLSERLNVLLRELSL